MKCSKCGSRKVDASPELYPCGIEAARRRSKPTTQVHLGTLVSSSRSYDVKAASRIYVFISGDHKHIGLTNDQSGRNLPPPPSDVHVWVKLREIPYNRNAIYQLNIDPMNALLYLKARGYHVVSPEAEIIPFPPRPVRR